MQHIACCAIEPFDITDIMDPANCPPKLEVDEDDNMEAYGFALNVYPMNNVSRDYLLTHREKELMADDFQFRHLPLEGYVRFCDLYQDACSMPTVWQYLEGLDILDPNNFVSVINDTLERWDDDQEQFTDPRISKVITEDDAEKLLTFSLRLAATHPNIFDKSYKEVVTSVQPPDDPNIPTPPPIIEQQALVQNCLTTLWFASIGHFGNAIEYATRFYKGARTLHSLHRRRTFLQMRKESSDSYNGLTVAIKDRLYSLTESFRKEPSEWAKYVFACMLAANLFNKSLLDFIFPWSEDQLKQWDWTSDFPEPLELSKYQHFVLNNHWITHQRLNPFRDHSDKKFESRNALLSSKTITAADKVKLEQQGSATQAESMVGKLGNIRVFKSKLYQGRKFFLCMRHMYPTEPLQNVYNMACAEFKYHPTAHPVKAMTSSELEAHRLVVVQKWDTAMKRKHYKETAEAKAAAKKKQEVEHKKQQLAAMKQQLEAAKAQADANTVVNGRSLRARPERTGKIDSQLKALAEAEKKTLQEEAQVEKILEAIEAKGVSADPAPLRTKKKRGFKKDKVGAIELQPPKRSGSKDVIEYNAPGEDWMLVFYYRVQLLCALGPLLKAAFKKGIFQGSDGLEAIETKLEDDKKAALLDQYTTNFLDQITKSKKKTAKLSKQQIAAIKKAAMPNDDDVDYSGAIINNYCKKIAISLDLVDKLEFKPNTTGNIQFSSATPEHIYNSLNTWLTSKEIETLALASAYIGAIFEKGERIYNQIANKVLIQFKASDKHQLELMLDSIYQTLVATNRSSGNANKGGRPLPTRTNPTSKRRRTK
jgi:hypothetical protein